MDSLSCLTSDSGYTCRQTRSFFSAVPHVSVAAVSVGPLTRWSGCRWWKIYFWSYIFRRSSPKTTPDWYKHTNLHLFGYSGINLYHILVNVLLCTFVIASKKNMSILILWLVWWALKFITFISMQDIVLTKLVEWNFEVQVTSILGESTHYIILGHRVSYFILVEFYIGYSAITRTGHQFQARLTPKKRQLKNLSYFFWFLNF